MMPYFLLTERENNEFCRKIMRIFMETLGFGGESSLVGCLNGHVYVSHQLPYHFLPVLERFHLRNLLKCLISLLKCAAAKS